jgi:hypothetical protein
LVLVRCQAGFSSSSDEFVSAAWSVFTCDL